MTPITKMFQEGGNGDKVLKQTLLEVKNVYRDALRSSTQCIKDSAVSELPILTILPKGISEPFELKMCENRYIIIDKISGRT